MTDTIEDRLLKLESIRFQYKMRELEEKIGIIKVLLDDLVVRVSTLENMNRDYGK